MTIIRSSFSQHNMFAHCKRQWWYSYIKKLEVPQNLMYAHAGSVLHNTLETYYKGDVASLDELKQAFNIQWSKYKLENTDLKLKKDLYWSMVLAGVNLALPITKTEMRISYPEVVAYLDGVDENNDDILDWKSSTRRSDTYDEFGDVVEEGNETEYKLQLKLYSWLYYRKFGRLPNNATVYYLKYKGTKQKLSFKPTIEDVYEAEDWFFNILSEMQEIKENNIVPQMAKHCNFFCPFKNICGTGDSPKLIMHIWGNKIKIEGPIPDILNAQLDKKFSYTLLNSEIILAKNPHANVEVHLWNKREQEIPIGLKIPFMKTLNDYAQHQDMKFNLKIVDNRIFDKTKIEMPETFISGKKLRGYQQEAVNKFMRQRIGLLELATGAGKTILSTEIIRLLGMKTLFIVDKKQLLNQTVKTIKENLGIEPGTICAGQFNPSDITVATIQTLMKKHDFLSRKNQYVSSIKSNRINKSLRLYIDANELSEEDDIERITAYKNKLTKDFKFTTEETQEIDQKGMEFYKEYLILITYLRTVRLCIFDECHHVSSRSYKTISDELLNTEYRLGLSGTGFRDDGHTMSMFGTTGLIIHKVSVNSLTEKGWLTKARVQFIENYMTPSEIKDTENNALTGLINETPKYNNYYNYFITTNNSRNKQIVEQVKKYKSKKILILVKLIEHGEILEELIEGSKYLHGSTNEKEREKLFDDFMNGDLDILISTISIFSEGVDVPALEVAINAAANKGHVKTIQIIGRILRLLEGKIESVYIDFLDPNKFFRNASLSRINALRNQGHRIDRINIEEVNTK